MSSKPNEGTSRRLFLKAAVSGAIAATVGSRWAYADDGIRAGHDHLGAELLRLDERAAREGLPGDARRGKPR